ncbi:hypothetical protein BJV82DRAFT_633117 [Fennellomyces sp. T-0311]|nr:hypothetical protein BJV82DRAFT_633117 [Fennellomyces sp. T-0311]
MLKNGTALLAEYKNKGDEPYYCPYKGCTLRCTTKGNLLIHMRRWHDPDLPKIDAQKNIILRTSGDRKIISFDEHCRDLLEENEKFDTIELPRTRGVVYCPYIGCKTTNTKLGTLFKHIRRFHDPTFPFIPHTRSIRIFLDRKGRSILFDENSRNTLRKNQKIVPCNAFGEPL